MKLGPLLVAGVTFASLYLALMAITGSSPEQSFYYLLATIR